MKVLVTGGVRSGKSSHAEALVRERALLTYIAPGPAPEEEADPDWALRIAAHRDRRPLTWTTVETRDVARAVREAAGPVLVDCLGTWVTGLVDDASAWEWPQDEVTALVDEHVAGLAAAITEMTQTAVVVTNEVGLGVVPEHRSGRLFRDLLGRANQQVATACDEVHLVVAGRVLRL